MSEGASLSSNSSSESIKRRLKESPPKDDLSEVSAENPLVTQAQKLENLFEHGLDDYKQELVGGKYYSNVEDDDLESELGKLAKSEELLRNELEILNQGSFHINTAASRQEVVSPIFAGLDDDDIEEDDDPSIGVYSASTDSRSLKEMISDMTPIMSNKRPMSPPLILPPSRSPLPPALQNTGLTPPSTMTLPPARYPSQGESQPTHLPLALLHNPYDFRKLSSDMPMDEDEYYHHHPEQQQQPAEQAQELDKLLVDDEEQGGIIMFTDQSTEHDHDVWLAKQSQLGPTFDVSDEDEDSSVSRQMLFFYWCCRGQIPIWILMCCMLVAAPVAIGTGVTLANREDNFLPFMPTTMPSFQPSGAPTLTPTLSISPTVSSAPTKSFEPSIAPTISPEPTIAPSTKPTNNLPTMTPSSSNPSSLPTLTRISDAPSLLTTVSSAPTTFLHPSASPSSSDSPTGTPSISTSSVPTIHSSSEPTLDGSENPTVTLSTAPSTMLSLSPSESPVESPSAEPTATPSLAPTQPPTSVATTDSPTAPVPSQPTLSPTPAPTPRDFDLFEFLVSISPDMGQALQDPKSPQYKAYLWLAGNADIDTFIEERIIQRYTMAVLFFSTNGNNWLQNSGWLSDTDECTWFAKGGNICGRNSEIKRLELNYNDMEGTLPAELSLLSKLDEINLGGGPSKSLFGSLPPELGTLNLKEFRVPNNNLTGTIPDEYVEWERIEWLDMGNNSLEGSIVTGFWSVLEILNLSKNRFRGKLPRQLASLRDLEQFDASENELTGEIPSEIADLNGHLRILNLANNKLDTLPSTIGKLKRLQRLFLDHNTLKGSIPTEIGNLERLRDLTLSYNNFSGQIPTTLAWLGELRQVLDLSSNQLTGPIPPELGDINGRVRYLYLSDNSLSGEIPSTFSKFEAIVELRVERNALSSVHSDVCQIYNRTKPLFYADCNVDCPCCTHCCDDYECRCLYAGTTQDWMCY